MREQMQLIMERFKEGKRVIDDLVKRKEYDAALAETNGIDQEINNYMIGYAFAGEGYADFMSQSRKLLEQLSNARKRLTSYISSNQHRREEK